MSFYSMMDSFGREEEQKSAIKLTGFNAFPLDHGTNLNPSPSQWTVGSLSSTGTGTLLVPANGEKQHHQALAIEQQQQQQQQFQIVWRQLTFEVDTNSYDKIIAKTFNRMKTAIWQADSREGHQTRAASTKRLIFENLNGQIKSGQLAAIIGPSGAGKTSLLNALCGRTENYSGSIELRGGPSNTSSRLRSTIIPQKDYLLEQLTVRESLLYASRILNPNKKFDHKSNIARVVEMLKLSLCLESRISKLSGGEHKRVSIAQELLSEPDILILDEPTSGLDSLNCKNLIKSLSALAEASQQGKLNPIAIVMTIHQPESDVFNMFDHVYCMARGGKVIYDGHPKQAIQVIESSCAPLGYSGGDEEASSGGLMSALTTTNPANLLIEIASHEYGPKPIDALARLQIKQFESFLMEQQQKESPTEEQQQVVVDCPYEPPTLKPAPANQQQLTKDKRLMTTSTASENLFFYHTNLLARRAFLATIRDPLTSFASLVFHLLIPLVMYTVYPTTIGTVRACPIVVRDIETLSLASNQTLGLVEDLQEQLSTAYECATMFFLTTYSFSMCGIALAALAFPMNMHVLLKEVRNGWYDLSSFVTAKTVASFPFEVLFPVMSICMIYVLLDMPGSYLHWRLGAMAIVVVLISMLGQTNGLIFGALCMDSVQSAVFLGLASTLPQVLLSGYTARVKQMPRWLGNLSYLSPFRYALDLMNMVRFGFGLCPCDQSTAEYLSRQPPEFTDIPEQLNPLFKYYLRDLMADPSLETTTARIATAADDNATLLEGSMMPQHIPGIYYELKLNSSEKANLIDRLESDEIDIFKQLAEQLTSSFSFGRSVTSCDTIRAQLLNMFETPHDAEMPWLFAYLIGLLISLRIVLFLIMKYRIGSRI